ncbi:ATP-grasp fold amidoligase family protein [Trinickia acidisoli]|uniref:ATP-grasp fold amidoligase family protein n=1 Tax=Trinickia acidisoli TaxID=2767482 RepID=UPI002852EEF7|nr:ATP-grasp fold amidoligase family protein [Trinickia acidisoli]
MNEVEVRRRPLAATGRSTPGAASPAYERSAPPLAHATAHDSEGLRGAVKAAWHGAKRLLPDYAFMQIQHRRLLGRWPNMRHPEAFNEAILLRCLHPEMRWVDLTDKLAVREYVREKIGDEHLIPLIAAPETFTREVFDALPSSFVMKANHGCAFVEVVRDKSATSFDTLSKLADKWLSIDFYRSSRERHYRYIKPRIYFEQLLVDGSGMIPSDLKLHIFGGRPGGPCIHTMVIADRFGDVRGDLYDEHWHRIDVSFGDYRPSDAPIPRPANWGELERLGLRLAEGFDYVRVDLYSLESEVYFGELTFTPGAGLLRFMPESHDYRWGRMLKESAEGFERMRRTGCF